MTGSRITTTGSDAHCPWLGEIAQIKAVLMQEGLVRAGGLKHFDPWDKLKKEICIPKKLWSFLSQSQEQRLPVAEKKLP